MNISITKLTFSRNLLILFSLFAFFYCLENAFFVLWSFGEDRWTLLFDNLFHGYWGINFLCGVVCILTCFSREIFSDQPILPRYLPKGLHQKLVILLILAITTFTFQLLFWECGRVLAYSCVCLGNIEIGEKVFKVIRNPEDVSSAMTLSCLRVVSEPNGYDKAKKVLTNCYGEKSNEVALFDFMQGRNSKYEINNSLPAAMSFRYSLGLLIRIIAFICFLFGLMHLLITKPVTLLKIAN